jgi:penicillin-binding protein 1A
VPVNPNSQAVYAENKDGMIKKWLLRLTSLMFFMSVLGIIGMMLVFWHFGRDLPDHSQLAKYEPSVLTRVHAGNGALLAEFATQKRVFVPINAIPKPVIYAFLSAEDKGFYHHFGIDLWAVTRAMVTNIANLGRSRRPIGASTITQQVAKNFLLTNELSYERKIKEAILAMRIESAFTKDRILELYLNEIYLGFGSYGVAAAALNYFDKPLDQLTVAEAAYLAALPKAPNNYHPTRKYASAIVRRNWVLSQMRENGYITEAEEQAAANEPLVTRDASAGDGADAPFFVEEVRREIAITFGDDALYTSGLSVRTSLDPELQALADMALVNELEALDKRQGWRGPLGQIDLSSTLPAGQIEALRPYREQLLSTRLPAVVTEVNAKRALITVLEADDHGDLLTTGEIPFALADWAYPPRNDDGTRGAPLKRLDQALAPGDVIVVQRPETAMDRLSRHPDLLVKDTTWALGQVPLVQGAVVVMDPHTGRVLAMTGGFDPAQTQFNRATQARRQPGSAFKPFVYLAALDDGYSPVTKILDAPLVVDQGPGLPKWKPANYTRRFYGPSIMRLGIEQSRNLMTARLAMQVGMPMVQDYAKRFGIDDNLPDYLSMSLGAGETTLLQMTAAYGMIVNGGRYIEPSMIDRVQDRYGQTIYRHDKRDCQGCQVLDVNTEDHLTPPALIDTRPRVTDANSAYQMVSMLEGVVRRGTARRMKDLPFPLAGKTGTTNDNTNGWFVGFTPDMVVGVYVGFDKLKPLGKREGGSTAAVPIFESFITAAMQNRPQIPFRRPDGINLYTINARTGVRASPEDPDSLLEAFKPGQEPLIDISDSAIIGNEGTASGQGERDVPSLY